MAHGLRVALDLSVVPHALGGVSRYILGLASGLRLRAGEGRLDLALVDVPATHPGLPPHPVCDHVLADPGWMRVPLLRRLPMKWGWEESARPARLSSLFECDVYHSSGVQPLHPDGAVPVVTLYDTGALEHPEWYTSSTVDYARMEIELIRKGARALAISSWTAGRAAGLLGLEGERIGVAPGAADDSFSPGEADPGVLERLGLEADRYVLHVGNFVPRKNIPFLLEVWRKSGLSGRGLSLLLAGAGGWKRPAIGGDGIKVVEAVLDSDILSLYRGSRAVVLPSSFEGLGLPALEASACGCALLSSDSSALPETVGSAGLLLPDGNEDAWVDVLRCLRDDGFVGDLRRAALSAPRRRWSDAADCAIGFYRSVSG